MDKQCQLKTKYMQKFVPSLSTLIEKLGTESKNRADVVKMQLILKHLICPNISVTIDELVKSEKAIEDFFSFYKCTINEPLESGERTDVCVDDPTCKDPISEERKEAKIDVNRNSDKNAFTHIEKAKEILKARKYYKEFTKNEDSTYVNPVSKSCTNTKSEKDIELVEIEKSEEFILPDSEVGVNMKVNCDSREIEDQEIEFDEYPYEGLETELIVLELVNGSKDLKEANVSDPLNVEEKLLYANENMLSNRSAVNDTYEDDDVQIVENINSPISIDSDEDIPSHFSGQQIALINTENFKNTAHKSPTVAKKKVKKCRPQHCIVDTIELLDSSDDEKIDQSKKKIHCDNNAIKRNRSPSENVQSKCIVPKRYSSISTRMLNFLNAINLQPVNKSNPPSFFAQLLNKNITVPHAFNGNTPSQIDHQRAKQFNQTKLSNNVSSAVATKEQIYRRWLDNFLLNFSNPTQLASQTCFILLQRVLKNKLFLKIKNARSNLNNNAQSRNLDTPTSRKDVQLLLGLKTIFYNTDSKLSEIGCRFCEFATNKTSSKSNVLTTDVKTGRVTSCTRTGEDVKQIASILNKSNTSVKVNTAFARKKQRHNVDEYTPSKTISIVSGEETVSGERKRSLRTNRGKRYDNNFSYNEDHEEEEEYNNYKAIQRKIEQKRLEAELRRKNLATSFEKAYIEAFSKSMVSRIARNGTESKRLEFENSIVTRKSSDNIHQKDKIDFNILPKQRELLKKDDIDADVIICSDESDKDDFENLSNAPKNTDRSVHMMSKNHDICVLCGRRVLRIVHHYVNEHRDFEVYTSRLSPKQFKRFQINIENTSHPHLHKNGQSHFEAKCAFCQKRSRLMLSYWYQHFTMHTGEYAYRCSVCGIRKPTRSLLQAHININCRNGGSVEQDFIFDPKTSQIEVFICTLCKFVQLQRSNVVRHLQTQHGLREIFPKHIKSVVILKTAPILITIESDTINKPFEIEMDDLHSISTNCNIEKGQEELNLNQDTVTQFNYDDDSPCDDISFMICGMLDVQMKTD